MQSGTNSECNVYENAMKQPNHQCYTPKLKMTAAAQPKVRHRNVNF